MVGDANVPCAGSSGDARGLEPQGENASLGPELQWTAPDYGGAYEIDHIYRIRRSGQQWEEVPTRYAGNTSYVYAPLLDPNISYVFRVRAYDQPPASGEAPWSSWPEWSDGDGSDPPLDNLKGRVAARAHRAKNSVVTVGGGGTLEGPTLRAATDRVVAGSTIVAGEVTFTAGSEVRLEAGFSTADGAPFRAEVDPSKQSGGPEWRLVFFSYDAEGNVRRRDHFVPGLGQVTLTYRRDRQSRVTRRKTNLRGLGKTFYQWYEYNERGLVKRVYASTSPGKPSSPEVTYAYGPDGQVKSTDWEGVSGQIARRYNERGWLTGIGDLGAPTGFAAGYDYFPDGNVETMESNAPGNSSLTYYWTVTGDFVIFEEFVPSSHLLFLAP